MSVWLLIAQTLSTFNIRYTKDEQGNTIPVTTESVSGLVYHPKPYDVDLQPRSQMHLEMLRDVQSQLQWDQGDADELKGEWTV